MMNIVKHKKGLKLEIQSHMKHPRHRRYFDVLLAEGATTKAIQYLQSFSNNKEKAIASDSIRYIRYNEKKWNLTTFHGALSSKEPGYILRMYETFFDPNKNHSPTSVDKGQWIGVEIECTLPNTSFNIGNNEDVECESYCDDHDQSCCQDCDHDCIHNDRGLSGIGALKEYIKKEKIKYCTVKSDGSIAPGDGYFGAELTILCKRSDRTNLKKLCSTLNKLGAVVNKSCGMHVHFDQRDLVTPHANMAEIKPVLMARGNRIGSCLPFLAKLVPASRRDNSYCQLEVSSINGNRYSAVNMTAFSRYKTIEVRLHSSTTDYEKINNWIDILLLPLTYDKKTLPTINNLEHFCEVFDVPEKLISYMEHREKKFESPMPNIDRQVEESDEAQLQYTGTDWRPIPGFSTSLEATAQRNIEWHSQASNNLFGINRQQWRAGMESAHSSASQTTLLNHPRVIIIEPEDSIREIGYNEISIPIRERHLGLEMGSSVNLQDRSSHVTGLYIVVSIDYARGIITLRGA